MRAAIRGPCPIVSATRCFGMWSHKRNWRIIRRHRFGMERDCGESCGSSILRVRALVGPPELDVSPRQRNMRLMTTRGRKRLLIALAVATFLVDGYAADFMLRNLPPFEFRIEIAWGHLVLIGQVTFLLVLAGLASWMAI